MFKSVDKVTVDFVLNYQGSNTSSKTKPGFSYRKMND